MKPCMHAARVTALSLLCATAWAQDVVIGQCAPLTGSLAGTGRAMAGGAQLAFDEANAQGGVNGLKIKHMVQDDGYDTARTLACSQDFIQAQKAVALIGYAGTGNIYELLAKKVLADAEISLIAPGSGSKALREPYNPYIFHIRASYEDEARSIVDHVVGGGAANRVAVFYQDDPFGQSGLDSIKSG